MASSFRTRTWAILLVLAVLVAVGSGTLTVVDVSRGRGLVDALADQSAPLVFFLVLFGLCALGWFLLPRSVRRMCRQQPNLLAETRWRWDDEGIEVSSRAGSSRIVWPELHRWISGRHAIVLLPQARLILTLPRRAGAESELRDLEATIRRFAAQARAS
jgi:hypothetical protein